MWILIWTTWWDVFISNHFKYVLRVDHCRSELLKKSFHYNEKKPDRSVGNMILSTIFLSKYSFNIKNSNFSSAFKYANL